MPLIFGLEVMIQFCFAFHVLKTGRPYWWIFIIMSFPVMGCVIYYFVEIFPGSREHRNAFRTARKLTKALNPTADLKKRAAELEICGSVDNRMALAEECMNHQMFAEAERLYESCVAGAFASDGTLLFALARAAIENGNWAKAAATIERLRVAAPKYRPQEVSLLEARLAQGHAQHDRAITLYRDLLPTYTGLEARYRYAAYLADLERHEPAIEAFEEILKHAKRFASSLEDEQQWVSAARRDLAALSKGK